MFISKRRAGWIALAMTLTCAGCAATPSVTVGAPPPSGGGAGTGTTPAPRLVGSAAIDGAYKAAGTFSTHAQVLVGSLPQAPAAHDTCADYAKGFAQDPTSFVVPELHTVGATTLYLTTTLAAAITGRAPTAALRRRG